MISPDAAGFAAVHGEGRAQVVWARIVADTETPVSAMLKLGLDGRGGFLLESVEGGAVRGRYSLLGLAPDLVWRAQGDACEANRRFQDDPHAFEPCAGGTLEELRQLVASIRMELPDALPSALSLLVGYMGYETAALVERLPAPKADPLGVPDMLFMRPTLLLVFDRLKDELFLVAPAFPDGRSAEAHYQAARERVETAAAKLAQPVPVNRLAIGDVDVTPQPQTAPATYAAMVDRAKDYILAGDIFQVVLAQRFAVDFPLPPFDLYRSLRRINPSPFLYFLDLPGFALIGSSPEILVRVRDGEVTIRPIAGTRPRGSTGAEDAANRDSLLADPKELSEHLMLLDLGRNDIGRVAKPGSVAVTERNNVEFYSHVMHIVSNVRADIADDKDSIDALLAGFPAGTVSGAPKVRAMEIIHELESEKRGAYAGG
ncbi:MAG: chorismate-binding protein, partial [Sphingomonadaceae bacterium]|nr:chorismate-binding protein [Sphingomonadaceae bacterium]